MKRRRSLYARPEIIRGEQCIGCAAIFDAPVMCEGTGCPTLWRAGQISAAAVGDCSSVPEIDPVTVAGLREHQARQARRPIPQRSARPTRSPAWCSRIRTVRRSTRTCSPTGSTARPGGRASGDPPTRPAPATRRPRWPQAYRRRSSANDSGTRPSLSPWIPTATSCLAWTSEPP
jgi:hypothetical protein